MIATITLNPTLDRNIVVHGLVLDEANRWTSLRLYAGGKGIDVSRAIHEMGGKTIAYGFIGGDTGRMVEILLDEEGVPYSFTPISEETRTNFIIADTKSHKQTRIDAPGPSISKRELERFAERLRRVEPRPELMVIGGSVPPGIPTDVYNEIVAECNKFKVRCILDSAGQWLKEGIKAKPYLIKPNVHEAEELLGTQLPTEEAIIKAAIKIVEMGIEIAVISRGGEGLIAASKESIVKAVPPPVKVVSAVGAGDCAVAGLALKLANGEPLIEACRLAAAMGAAAVLTPGTELAHRADVIKLLPKTEVSETPTRQWVKTIFTTS
jgi:6-phosphofructokinase 2